MMFYVNLTHLIHVQLLLLLALTTRLINVIVSVTFLVDDVVDVNLVNFVVDPSMIISLLVVVMQQLRNLSLLITF